MLPSPLRSIDFIILLNSSSVQLMSNDLNTFFNSAALISPEPSVSKASKASFSSKHNFIFG